MKHQPSALCSGGSTVPAQRDPRKTLMCFTSCPWKPPWQRKHDDGRWSSCADHEHGCPSSDEDPCEGGRASFAQCPWTVAQWKASDLQHSVQTLNVKERVPERHKSIECTKVLALQALAWTRLLSEGLIQEVGILLGRLAILDVTLPVQHPCWDLELQGFAYNCPQSCSPHRW